MLRLIKMTILSSSLLPLSNRNVYSAHSNSSFPPRCLCFRPKFTMRHFIVLFRPLAILVFLGLVWRLYNENSGPDSAGANNLVHHAIHESLRVWKWEILSGHYPSRDLPKSIVTELRDGSINNPALPNETINIDSRSPIIGAGFQRQYIDSQTIGRFFPNENSSAPSLFPKRPPPGSIADFDVIMRTCNYKNEQTSRDCLEFLRHGVGLDDTNLFQKDSESNVLESSYIYIEKGTGFNNQSIHISQSSSTKIPLPYYTHSDLMSLTHFNMSETPGTSTSATQISTSPCDPNHPRIFHLFWSGPFTSHPYMAILSFLYTQNLGLDQNSSSLLSHQPVCRPKLWVWIWDPHSLSRNANAEHELHRTLASNMWSRPFLHPRFQNIIEFKFWDVAKHLNAMGDILEGWREALGLTKNDGDDTLTVTNEGEKYDISSSKFVTIVSDMARFVITYLYGGIYIDADTIFLRDWEELWGYRGAFAYRWSHIKNEYNTAVLKMNKGSMLGEMLIRAARRGPLRKKWWDWRRKDDTMEFHPKEGISKYVEEMDLVLPVEPNGRKGLLWMLPVALFDPAWLATEGYETGRMIIPGFKSFNDFFQTPSSLRHEAELLGFDGFFRGAYAYHWHNQWQTPFDGKKEYPNWGNKLTEHTIELEKLYPSLGLNFTHTPENRFSSHPAHTSQSNETSKVSCISFCKWHWPWRHSEEADDNSLPWSAIIKRTMEAFIRGEAPNLYGEYFVW